MADTTTLAQRVDGLEREHTAIVSAIERGRRTRLYLFLAVLLLILATCAMFYKLYQRVRSPESEEKFLRLTQEELTGRTPELRREMETLVKNVKEPVREAITKQLEKDQKLYVDTVMKEREPLEANLEKRLTELLERHQDQILKKHERILKEEFPSFENEELYAQMIANMQQAMHPLIKEYYVDEFKKQLERIYGIYDDFSAVDPVDRDDKPLDVQLRGLLYELLRVRLAATSKPSLQPDLEEMPKTKPKSLESAKSQ